MRTPLTFSLPISFPFRTLLHSKYSANVLYFLLQSFSLAHKNSVCAAVTVLYNTLVTSYIFWAHHIKEYCIKNVPFSGHNETVPNTLLVKNRICYIT